MKSIPIAELKAHLSAELKRVQKGETLVVLDHRNPVALVAPLPGKIELSKPKRRTYAFKELPALMTGDPLAFLDAERGEE